MRTVDVNYRKFYRNRTRHIEVPERWEDLKPYQFEVCAQIHIEPPSDEEFLQRFFGLEKHVIKHLSKFEIYKLTDMVGFAVTPSATTDSFFMDEIPGTGLHAPGKRLNTMTLEHFAMMDSYFFSYANDPSDVRLCELVAALYLKKREVITEIDFTSRVDYIAKKVDTYSRYAIFLNYLFVRKWLARSFRFLFDDGGEPEKASTRKFKKPEKAVNTLPRWVDIIEGFVGDDILNYDKYIQMNCIRAFKVMNSRIKNFKKNAK